MKKNYLLVITLLTCLLSGCSQQPEAQYVTAEFTESAIKDCEDFEVDTLETGIATDVAREFFVYEDSILIVLNVEFTKDNYLEIYNLKTKECLGKFFKSGHGHNEMQSANVDLNKNILFVNDFKAGQYAFVNMDSILKGNLNVEVKKVERHGVPTVVPYKDDILLENPYCFENKKLGIEQGIDDGVPRFIVGNKQETASKQNFKYNTRNVATDGRIICKPDGKRIVYAAFGQARVEVYDEDLTLLKVIVGPDNPTIEYNTSTFPGDSEVLVYHKDLFYAYLDYACDDDYVYLHYTGSFYDDGGTDAMKSYIIKTDWDGNFIECHKCDRYFRSISKGCEEGVFYATALDNDELPILLKLTKRQ